MHTNLAGERVYCNVWLVQYWYGSRHVYWIKVPPVGSEATLETSSEPGPEEVLDVEKQVYQQTRHHCHNNGSNGYSGLGPVVQNDWVDGPLSKRIRTIGCVVDTSKHPIGAGEQHREDKVEEVDRNSGDPDLQQGYDSIENVDVYIHRGVDVWTVLPPADQDPEEEHHHERRLCSHEKEQPGHLVTERGFVCRRPAAALLAINLLFLTIRWRFHPSLFGMDIDEEEIDECGDEC